MITQSLRDDLQNKMISIRERLVKEADELEEQLEELGKLIEQEEAKRSDLERSVSKTGSGKEKEKNNHLLK